MKANLRIIRTLGLILGVMVIVAACSPMTGTLPGSQTPAANVFLPGIEQPGVATSPLQPPAAVAETTAAVAETTAAVAETTAAVAEPAAPEPTAAVPPTEAPRPAVVGPVWQWVSSTFMDGALLEPADPSRYTFQLLDDGNALVQADCNFGTATYQDTSAGFSFGPIGTTKMACPPDSLDSEFLGQLRNTGRYEVSDDGLTIYLLEEAGIMQLRAAEAAPVEVAPVETAALPAEPVVVSPTTTPAPTEPAPTAPAEPAPQPVAVAGLEGSSWVLRSLWVSGQEMLPVQDTVVTLEVSEDGGRISGSTGCNQYRAIWTAGDTGAAVTAPALMTRKTCAANVMVQEVEFIDALLRARTYDVVEDVLTLYASDGEITMVLLRK